MDAYASAASTAAAAAAAVSALATKLSHASTSTFLRCLRRRMRCSKESLTKPRATSALAWRRGRGQAGGCGWVHAAHIRS